MVQAVKELVADDLLITEVETIAHTSAVIDASRLMLGESLQHVIVIDTDRQVVGVLTQNDILQSVIGANGQQEHDGQNWQSQWETEVASLISHNLVTVKADVPLEELAWLLVINRIACLPVVNDERRLIGAVNLSDVISHFTDGIPSCSDKGFQFYAPPGKEERPNFPAFFRRACGTLVMPEKSLGDLNPELKYARLGYDSGSGRVAVKLVADQGPGDQRVSREKIIGDDVYLVIPASDFVEHFNINPRIRAYDIKFQDDDILLTPRQ